MTDSRSEQHQETPAEMLARSAFGFALFALIPAVIAWFFFFFAPASPFEVYRVIRMGIVIGFGVLILALLGLMIMIFRTPPTKLLPHAERFSRFFQHPIVSLITVIIVLQANIFIFLLLRGIASSITNPAKGVMIAWSLLFVGMLFIIHKQSISRLWRNSASTWASIGFSLVAVVLFILIASANSWLINVSGFNDILRGGLDYRQLYFYDDGQPVPSPPDFWAEQAQTTVRWSPYTYWMMGEYNGDYITIGSDGIRETPQYDNSTHSIFMFGGSTMWGEGARDAYTIPGHMARLLNDEGTPQTIVNYGQSGYVSMQDIILFQLQLQQGNIPDIAVFYQGFNDILSAYSAGQTGVTLQENMRLNDSEAGRRLRSGQPVLQLPNVSLDSLDLSSAGVEPASAQAIADNWFANVDLAQSLADAYAVDVIFVWQPALIFKETLTESEQGILARTETERPDLFSLYAEVDAIVQREVAATEQDNIIVLSDLFAGSDAPIFHDLVHITEIGNLEVAEALLPTITSLVQAD